MDFYIKRGDTLPPLVVELAYSDGSPVDLTSATGRILMRRIDTSELVLNDEVALAAADSTATWDWVNGGAEIAGEFRVEIEVELAAGLVQTFPTVGQLLIRVVKDLGGVSPAA